MSDTLDHCCLFFIVPVLPVLQQGRHLLTLFPGLLQLSFSVSYSFVALFASSVHFPSTSLVVCSKSHPWAVKAETGMALSTSCKTEKLFLFCLAHLLNPHLYSWATCGKSVLNLSLCTLVFFLALALSGSFFLFLVWWSSHGFPLPCPKLAHSRL